MDCVELSSDSSDTINNLDYHADTPGYDLLEYNSKSSAAPLTTRDNGTSTELETLKLLSEKYGTNSSSESSTNDINHLWDNSSSLKSTVFFDSETDSLKVSPTKNDAKKRKKNENDIKKQQKAKERAEKIKAATQEKQLKQAVAQANKNIKPTECLKYIQVQIDNDVINEPYGKDILTALQTMGVTYRVQSQIVSGCITWTRTVESQLVNAVGQLSPYSEKQDANEFLLIMSQNDFVRHVDSDTLSAHIQSLKAVLENKRIILAIYALQSYKKQKNQPQGLPTVSARQIENALTEMQLLCNTAYRLVESASEVGLLVEQCTKSIAEIPFKQQKSETFQQTDWYMAGDNRDCVKVDKDGNGLKRLWKQMLTMFPLARLETAEAIMDKYPTVSSLMEAYDKCASPNEAEHLLQDIQIRRAAGPLSSSRRIGPELSKKIYNFFSATDPELLYDQS